MPILNVLGAEQHRPAVMVEEDVSPGGTAVSSLLNVQGGSLQANSLLPSARLAEELTKLDGALAVEVLRLSDV